MFSGGMMVLDRGLAGDEAAVGDPESSGPGGGGRGSDAALLEVPGKTTVSES